MIETDSIPAIVRATGIMHLRSYPSREILAPIRKSLADPSPLVRLSALGTLDMLQPAERLPLAITLLEDPTHAVRLEAARVLAGTPQAQLSTDNKERLRRATEEYEKSIAVNEDRPEAHLQMGVLHAGQGRLTKAEEAYRTALRLNPRFTQTYVNLADLHRMQGRDDLGEAVLREAIETTPNIAEVHHALGLLLARSDRLEEALVELRRAHMLEPDLPRFAYVYAIALNAAGNPGSAVDVLEFSYRSNPYDLDVLTALVTINRDRGSREEALRYARELTSIQQNNPAVQNLLRELEGNPSE
jgi:tetratricopeptide (TPR) repeat protein